MTVWTPAQLRVFLAQAAGDRLFTLWLFYVLTGVRRGEALALRWCDIDLEAATAAIRRSLAPVDHRLVFGEPKTERGRRLIGLDPQLVLVLREHWHRHCESGRSLGLALGDDDLVFARPNGAPWHPERVSRRFARLVEATGAPRIRLHDLRHLHATRALADRLGHSSTAVTTDIHQHVVPHMDHDAACAVADLVFAPSAGAGSGGSR